MELEDLSLDFSSKWGLLQCYTKMVDSLAFFARGVYELVYARDFIGSIS